MNAYIPKYQFGEGTMKAISLIGTATLFAASSIGLAVSQSGTGSPVNHAQTTVDSSAQSSMNPDNPGTYATGKPLEMQSKEGFWGHVNPFARKKWVARQVDPIRERTNELDQLQAKNANDIRDVDSRATAGINRAMASANSADAHALDAANRANQANSLAVTADGKTTSLTGTVSNLDQYQQVSSTTLSFLKGHTALSQTAKSNLDKMSASLASEKGYIVEVQGYSRSGIEVSQAMADSVVRYLVTAHQIPVYRIYRTGLGKQQSNGDTQQTAVMNGVRVTVLQNSLATMSSANSIPVQPSSN